MVVKHVIYVPANVHRGRDYIFTDSVSNTYRLSICGTSGESQCGLSGGSFCKYNSTGGLLQVLGKWDAQQGPTFSQIGMRFLLR